MSIGDSGASSIPIAAIGYPVTTSEATPATPSEGNVWFKPSTGALSVYHSGAWKSVSGGGGAGGLPTATAAGEMIMADVTKAWAAVNEINLGNF